MYHHITDREVLFRKPMARDGEAIHRLINNSPPLDVNSVYSYYLLSHHHADTCMVAEFQGEIVGFISAYFPPSEPHTLFIWQVAVDEKMRGQKLASMMLRCLLSRPECSEATTLIATVNPSNKASRRLFEKYCQSIGSDIIESEFISESAFGEQSHEAEILLSIDLNPVQEQEKKYANF
jgi:L-2,4-diaminobutyric acid acetyltransferase